MHNWVPQRPDFKSALRVVKMFLNTQCYQYLWLTMWFHAKNQKKRSKNENCSIAHIARSSERKQWKKCKQCKLCKQFCQFRWRCYLHLWRYFFLCLLQHFLLQVEWGVGKCFEIGYFLPARICCSGPFRICWNAFIWFLDFPLILLGFPDSCFGCVSSSSFGGIKISITSLG